MSDVEFYREFNGVKRDVDYLNSLDRPNRDSLQSDHGGLLIWSKQNVGSVVETIETRTAPIVDVYGYIVFVFANDTSKAWNNSVDIHGPVTTETFNFGSVPSNFDLIVDNNMLKLQKNSGDDAFIVNGFFFIL